MAQGACVVPNNPKQEVTDVLVTSGKGPDCAARMKLMAGLKRVEAQLPTGTTFHTQTSVSQSEKGEPMLFVNVSYKPTGSKESSEHAIRLPYDSKTHALKSTSAVELDGISMTLPGDRDLASAVIRTVQKEHRELGLRTSSERTAYAGRFEDGRKLFMLEEQNAKGSHVSLYSVRGNAVSLVGTAEMPIDGKSAKAVTFGKGRESVSMTLVAHRSRHPEIGMMQFVSAENAVSASGAKADSLPVAPAWYRK